MSDSNYDRLYGALLETPEDVALREALCDEIQENHPNMAILERFFRSQTADFPTIVTCPLRVFFNVDLFLKSFPVQDIRINDRIPLRSPGRSGAQAEQHRWIFGPGGGNTFHYSDVDLYTLPPILAFIDGNRMLRERGPHRAIASRDRSPLSGIMSVFNALSHRQDLILNERRPIWADTIHDPFPTADAALWMLTQCLLFHLAEPI